MDALVHAQEKRPEAGPKARADQNAGPVGNVKQGRGHEASSKGTAREASNACGVLSTCCSRSSPSAWSSSPWVLSGRFRPEAPKFPPTCRAGSSTSLAGFSWRGRRGRHRELRPRGGSLLALVRHEARGALNAAVAAVAAAAGAIVASAVWNSEHGHVSQALLLHKNPSTFVVDTAFIAFVVASDLARRTRWSRWCWLSAAALLLTGLAVDALTPFALTVSLFAALFFGWAVRWLLGAASVRPSTDNWCRGSPSHS